MKVYVVSMNSDIDSWFYLYPAPSKELDPLYVSTICYNVDKAEDIIDLWLMMQEEFSGESVCNNFNEFFQPYLKL